VPANSQVPVHLRLRMTVDLLIEHPEARVATFDVNGVIVEPPTQLPLGHPDQVLTGRSVFDYVHPEDVSVTIEAFRRARWSGASGETVRLATEPDRWITIRFADLQDAYGVHIGVLLQDRRGDAGRRRHDMRPARMRSGTIRYDANGEVIGCDEGFTQLLGWTSTQLAGVVAATGIHPDDLWRATDRWMDTVATGDPYQVRLRLLAIDGSWRWVDQVLHSRLDGRPDEHVLGSIVDVHDEVTVAEHLRSQELLLHRLTQVVPVGLLQVDRDERVVYANERLHQMLGVGPDPDLARELAGVSAGDRIAAIEAFRRVLTTGVDHDVEVEVLVPDTNEARRCLLGVRALTTETGDITGAIACVSDITEATRARVTLERDLSHHAMHDALTGLPNRTLLYTRIDDALVQTRGSDDLVGLLLADIDDFKQVNDSLGHRVGDELLRSVADRIQAAIGDQDVAARFGGDEFVVLLAGSMDPQRPRRTAEEILHALARPIEIDGRSLQVRASVGITLARPGISAEDLLRDADLAMYRAKANGRNRWEVYAPEMHAEAVARVDLEASLRRAIETDELFAVYQPIHEIDGGVCSVEALVRWRHPVRGLVSPGEFIPLAEETGLIVPIGRRMLELACHEAAGWHDGTGRPRLSVNLSANQLASPSLLDDVRDALDRSGLPAADLILEITETVLMEDPKRFSGVIEALRELGVALAIDDFGTGYSSLAYLQQLPVEILKIDKIFIDRITEGGRHTALTDGILGLCRNLSLVPVAEGVETQAQLDVLRTLGCPIVQGYLYARPLPPDQLAAHLAAHRHRPDDDLVTGPSIVVVSSSARAPAGRAG
jgi:diguanylate cyclase (GGDEF)-like protein/PAS domain S-box-containing protein